MSTASEALTIQRLSAQDTAVAQDLFRLLSDVFEVAQQPVSDAYASGLLAKPEVMVYAALHRQKVVGGLAAYVLPMWQGERAEAFLYDIAVAPASQRMGIGKALLAALAADCLKAGIKTMFVAAHAEDDDASAFYRATGGQEEATTHFTYRL